MRTPTKLSDVLVTPTASPVRPDISKIQCPLCHARAHYDDAGRITITHLETSHDAPRTPKVTHASAMATPLRRDIESAEWDR